jgi:hypothetical protein
VGVGAAVESELLAIAAAPPPTAAKPRSWIHRPLRRLCFLAPASEVWPCGESPETC